MKYKTNLINTNHFSDYYVRGLEEDQMLSRYFSLNAICINKHGNVNYFSTRDAAADLDEMLHTFFMDNYDVLASLYDQVDDINKWCKEHISSSIVTHGYYEVTYIGHRETWMRNPEKYIRVTAHEGSEIVRANDLLTLTHIDKTLAAPVTIIRIPKMAIVVSSKFADSTSLQLMTVNANLVLELLLRRTGLSLVSEYEYDFAYVAKGIYPPFLDPKAKSSAVLISNAINLNAPLSEFGLKHIKQNVFTFFIEYFTVYSNIHMNNIRMITQTREDDFVCVE